VIETAQDAFVSMDERGLVVEWNPQAERTFGWTRDEAVGRELAATLIPPRHRVRHREGLRRLLSTGDGPLLGRRFEVDALHREGHELPVELTISAVSTGTGWLFHAFLHETTDRRRAQTYLEVQHAVSSILAEAGKPKDAYPRLLAAIVGGMRWDRGALWLVDEAAQLIRCHEVWPDDPGGSFTNASRELRLRAGEGLPGSVWQRREPCWFADVSHIEDFRRTRAATEGGLREALALPLLGRRGAVLGVVEFFATRMGSPDSELVEMLGAVGAQIGQFIERAREAREAARLKEEFLALVSHELHTPLTTLLGYLDLASRRREDLPEPVPRYLDVIERNARRLLRLVDDLLFGAELQAGRVRMEPEEVELAQICEEAVEAARPRAEVAGVELRGGIETVPSSWGDPDRLAQVVDNLLVNAIKFAPGGCVEVLVRAEDEVAVIEVSDTGRGVPEDERERLFERFYRSSTTASLEAGGLGLGLSIVKTIVDLHQGELEVRDREGGGTTFRVLLPRSPSQAGGGEDRSDPLGGR